MRRTGMLLAGLCCVAGCLAIHDTLDLYSRALRDPNAARQAKPAMLILE